MPVGHPTDYIEEKHCKEIVEMQTIGMTIHEIAHKWNVCVSTIYNWKDTHAEFLDAFMRARCALRAFYDKIARDRMIDISYSGNSERLNDRTLKFMYYTNFKVSENVANSTVDLPESYYKTKDIDVKQAILDQSLALKEISLSQYDILTKTLQVQFDRNEGLKAREELQEIKAALVKVKGDK